MKRGQVIMITDEALSKVDAERCEGCTRVDRRNCKEGQRQLYCLNRTDDDVLWNKTT